MAAGAYTVSCADLNAVLAQEGAGWKIGPAGDGRVKVTLETGKTATVTYTLSTYAKAQFIAFEIHPGCEHDAVTHADTAYLGGVDTFDDMARRLLVMKSAIATARHHAQVKQADDKVLQI